MTALILSYEWLWNGAFPGHFLVLLGLVDGGRLVFINNELAEAAREAARWGAVQGRAATQAAGTGTAVTDEAQSRIVVSPTTTITMKCTDPGDAVPGADGDCGSGDLLTVTITSSVSPITPVIGDIIGPLLMKSEAQMTIH